MANLLPTKAENIKKMNFMHYVKYKGFQPLHTAVDQGDVEKVQKLLEQGTNPDVKTYHSKTALHLAIESRRNLNENKTIPLVKLLLEYKASLLNVDESKIDGPLFTALYLQQTKLQAANDQAEQDPEFCERMRSEAAIMKEVVDMILQHGTMSEDPLEAEYFLLCQAIVNNNHSVAKHILDEIIDADYRDLNPDTPLKIAVFLNHVEMADMLLNKEAQGRTPVLDIAIINKNIAMAKLLLVHGTYDDVALMDAMMSLMSKKVKKRAVELFRSLDNDLMVAQLMIQHYLQPTFDEGDGSTVMHLLAAWPRFVKIFSRSMVNQKNCYGQTPLHLACEWNNVRSVRYMIEKGADLTIVDDDGFTVLHYAANGDAFTYIADLVLPHGLVEINAKAENGETPLHWASDACWNYAQIMKRGGDINLKSYRGHPYHDMCWLRIQCALPSVLRRLQALGYRVENEGKYFREIRSVNGVKDLRPPEEAELETLKTQIISALPRRTLFDILTAGRGILTRCAKNPNWKELYVRCNNDFETVYPYFGGILNSRYYRAHLRLELTSLANERLAEFLGMVLPEDCSERIFKHLSNAEFKSFMEEIKTDEEEQQQQAEPVPVRPKKKLQRRELYGRRIVMEPEPFIRRRSTKICIGICSAFAMIAIAKGTYTLVSRLF